MRTIAQITLLPYAIVLAGALPVTPLVATPADETSPATNGVDVAWTRGSRESPVIRMKLGEVWLRHGESSPRRVTRVGQLAASGGMDRRTLVVQVVRNGQSDLLLYDLRTRRLREPPRGVNTRAWEWRGSVSGSWLLYGRLLVAGNANAYDVLLTNLRTGATRVLDAVHTHAAYAEPGGIAGRYAVWARCPENLCTVHRYDLVAKRHVLIAGDYTTAAVAPSITADGDVYYSSGRYKCGSSVRIERWRRGRTATIATLQSGYDLRFTATDGRRVLFDRVRCPSRNFDVYGVRVMP